MQLASPRRLTEAERRILDVLLSEDLPDAEELRAQIPHTVVVGRCDCGCPSVYLEVPVEVRPASAKPAHRWPRTADVAPAGDGLPATIVLFLKDGRLSGLEYASVGDQSKVEWPSSERITVCAD